MALNIKNDEAHRLASELAEQNDTTLTDAVTSALRETLERGRRTADIEAVLAAVSEIQHFVADLPDRDPRSPDEILGYDDRGLPN